MATTTGAIATVDSDRPPPLPLDSIPIIDLSLLSQSELFSLSMCSNSSFDLNRCDDVVIPKIDRSVFNESAGSRKQTYSRLRLAPAESSSSTKATIHRRTSRLRSSHVPTFSNISDPEQAENSQIIRMLKELFQSDHNFKELVPVEVEIDTKVVGPELLNPETSRKRGRPRKLENAVFISPPAAKRKRNDMVMKVVTYNDDLDREIVNSRGVKVNLENLGRMEDPYGLEIRRRTEGLSTKDELLGFLRGLNGEWATTRKKRRVVDASNFGDALPKGWRLSLSIKKKVDRVWLFCRRYISPSGRQFQSCKEVSTYLLSIVREENSLDVLVKKDKTRNRPVVLALSASSPQSNNCNDIMSKGASVNMDVIVQEDVTRKRPVVLALSTSKKQVNPDIVGPIDVQVEEVFKCLNCFMIFEGKISLLDHQVLAHKTETSSEMSEWTVVKGGSFECHFCNKTFHEMKEYNEHIGTHDATNATNETNTCEVLETQTAEKNVDPVLHTEVPENVVMENHDATFDDKLESSDSQSDDKINSETELKIDEHVHDLSILADDMNVDVSVKESCDEIEEKSNVDDNEFPERDESPDVSVSKSEICPMSINETNEKFQSSVGTSDCVDDKCDKGFDGDSAVIEKDSVVESNGQDDAVIETGVTNEMKISESLTAEKTVDPVIEAHEALFGDKLTSGDDKISCETESEINEHVYDINGSQAEHVNMNEDVSVEESCDDIVKNRNVDDNELPEKDNLPDVLVSESKSDLHETFLSGNVVGESVSAEVVNVLDSEIRVKSEGNGFEENMNDTHIEDDLASEKEIVSIEEESVSEVNKVSYSEIPSLVSQSNDVFSGVDNSSMISSKLQDSPKKEDVDVQHEFRSNAIESYNTSNMEDFDIKNDVNNVASSNRSMEVSLDDFQVFKNDESMNNEVNDLNLNTGVMGFDTGKNLEFCQPLVTPMNEQAFTFHDDDVSQRGFLDHYSIAETFDDLFGSSKFDEDTTSIDINELSLPFGGDPHKKDSAVSSNTFDVQTDLSMVNNNSLNEDLNGGRQSTRASSHNDNVVYPQVVPNQQQSGLFSDGFGLNGYRQGRSEPVEFSILSGRSEQNNPHHLQGGSSGVFPYNTGMGQGFGSDFWAGKNVENMGGRNVITGVCGWCRNEFHLLPGTTQGGGVGSLCPTCSAGVNML